MALVDPNISNVRSFSRDENGNFPIVSFSGDIEGILDECDKISHTKLSLYRCNLDKNSTNEPNSQTVKLHFEYLNLGVGCEAPNSLIFKRISSWINLNLNRLVPSNVNNINITYNRNVIALDQMRYNGQRYFYNKFIAKDIRIGEVNYLDAEKNEGEPLCK